MTINLSQQDMADLKKQGYSDQEINKAMNEVERDDLQESAGGSSSSNRSNPTQASAFSSKQMDDIAGKQLELNDILEQTEHILKGDIIIIENGKKDWKGNPHPEKNPLNEEGIRKVMLDLQSYINRHIILGDYDQRDINKIMRDYGRKINNLIFMKYEEMGMDTEEKRQEYQSLVINIVNLVYASYSRAKDGAERRSLREMINIQGQYQQQGMMAGSGGGVTVNANQQKQRGLLNPMRYIGGKYV